VFCVESLLCVLVALTTFILIKFNFNLSRFPDFPLAVAMILACLHRGATGLTGFEKQELDDHWPAGHEEFGVIHGRSVIRVFQYFTCIR